MAAAAQRDHPDRVRSPRSSATTRGWPDSVRDGTWRPILSATERGIQDSASLRRLRESAVSPLLTLFFGSSRPLTVPGLVLFVSVCVGVGVGVGVCACLCCACAGVLCGSVFALAFVCVAALRGFGAGFGPSVWRSVSVFRSWLLVFVFFLVFLGQLSQDTLGGSECRVLRPEIDESAIRQ